MNPKRKQDKEHRIGRIRIKLGSVKVRLSHKYVCWNCFQNPFGDNYNICTWCNLIEDWNVQHPNLSLLCFLLSSAVLKQLTAYSKRDSRAAVNNFAFDGIVWKHAQAVHTPTSGHGIPEKDTVYPPKPYAPLSWTMFSLENACLNFNVYITYNTLLLNWYGFILRVNQGNQ